jgi:hypothetical protein
MEFRWVIGSRAVPFRAGSHREFFDAGLDALGGLAGVVNLHVRLPLEHGQQWFYAGWVRAITPEVWDEQCYRLWDRAVQLYRGYASGARPEAPETFSGVPS